MFSNQFDSESVVYEEWWEEMKWNDVQMFKTVNYKVLTETTCNTQNKVARY